MHLRHVAAVGRLVVILAVFSAIAGAPGTRAEAKGTTTQKHDPLSSLQREFKRAIKRVKAATVICTPMGARSKKHGFSSGVLVTPNGYVLSDGDAGLVWTGSGKNASKSWQSVIRVRVPNTTGSGYNDYTADVLFRDGKVDTSLARIRDARSDFPYVTPGHSARVNVGTFAFALGNNDDVHGSELPSLTVGVVAGMDPTQGDPVAGPHEFLYTTAAVNAGVNGGPLIDIRGQLIGTISTYVDADKRFQFLGKVIPMDRIRHAMRHVQEAKPLFQTLRRATDPAPQGGALERVLSRAATRAYAATVSIKATRTRKVSSRVPLHGRTITLERYHGPFTGTIVGTQGQIITSLYNLTNVASYADPLWKSSSADSAEAGLRDITGLEVTIPTGETLPAKLVSHDRRIGVALLQADLRTVPSAAATFARARLPATRGDGTQRGSFCVCVGNPFGANRHAQPLTSVGILSKLHSMATAAAWRGQWQTDAAGLDANAGGPAVDIDGNIIGMTHLWTPAKHGRNSGISFVVPWKRIAAALPKLQAGYTPRKPLLGITFAARVEPYVSQVTPGGAADRGGMQSGDVVLAIDHAPTPTARDALQHILFRAAGDPMLLRVRRGNQELHINVTLGEKP